MNERIILTGASRGIGAAIAIALGKRGAHVILSARSEDGLRSTAEKVKAAGGTATVVPGDVSKAADRNQLVDRALAEGPVSALINNAGVEYPIAVEHQSVDRVEQQLLVNLHAPILLTKLLLPHFIEQKRGSIVMVSSMSGKAPTPYNAVYCATKFGLNGFTASLRIELEDTGVHAGIVCPSFVDEAGMFIDNGGVAPKLMKAVPLQRVVQGVLAALDGSAEVLVTPTPVRPMLALGQLFPTLDRKMLGWLGVLQVMKNRSAATVSDEDAHC